MGIIADYYRGKIKKADEQTGSLTRITTDLKEERDKLREANEELSRRLMAEKSTFSILYRNARKLSTLNLEELLAGIVELADKVIGAGNCAIFFLERLPREAAGGSRALELKADCLLKTRDFGKLQHLCVELVQNPAVPVEMRQAAEMWLQDG